MLADGGSDKAAAETRFDEVLAIYQKSCIIGPTNDMHQEGFAKTLSGLQHVTLSGLVAHLLL